MSDTAYTLGFVLDLPIPPSVNGLFPGKERRFKSPQYKAWITEAQWDIKAQKPKPVKGRFALWIDLPEGMAGDISNRIKAVEDLLVAVCLTADDRHAVSVTACRSPDVLKDRCRVRVEAR